MYYFSRYTFPQRKKKTHLQNEKRGKGGFRRKKVLTGEGRCKAGYSCTDMLGWDGWARGERKGFSPDIDKKR